MKKTKKLALNKLTIQNLDALEKEDAHQVRGGSRHTICYKTCGLECTVILTELCTWDFCH